jgi:two-component system, response regulator FlrC
MALAMQKINTQPSIHVLVVEDDRNLREALADTLQLADYQVTAVNSAEDAMKELAMQNDIALMVSDVNMGGMSGHELLRNVKLDYPQIPVILITAYASVSESVDAIKNGAVDYLVKPFAPNILVETIARHLGVAQLAGDEPVVSAAVSKQLLQLAQRVAVSDSTVLILGESGTGKEVLARYIHEHSNRRNQPFIAINCAAIPENMLEAMLFGYEKGAYTGAHASTPGKFEQANGGTLLLDEISEMDIGLQAKLLRVLQEREVERLGGRKTIKLDVRVIATSNRDMRSEVIAGKFREDLYYRLSVMPLRWLPLRERPEDIIPLAEKLLQKHAQKQNRRAMSLSASAQQALLSYSWPGNVRELDNTMQRALILQAGHLIQADDLGLDIAQSMAITNDFSSTSVNSRIPELTVPTFQFSTPVAEVAHNSAQQLGDDLRLREYEIIMNTLRLEGGSRKNTAERLGISARTLRYKIARLREEGFAITE